MRGAPAGGGQPSEDGGAVLPFGSDAVAAIVGHMNDDHAADSLLICQTLGGQPDATSVTMTGLDAEHLEFDVLVDGQPVPVRVPFARRVTERAQVRTEVVELYRRARASTRA